MAKVSYMGQLVYDDFDRASLGSAWDVANIGGASAVVSGNELLLSGGTGLNTEYITYNAYTTCLEKWRLSVPFQCTEKSATSNGFSIGIRGINPTTVGAQHSLFVLPVLNTGANSGKTQIRCQEDVASANLVDTSGSALAFSNGDELLIEVERNQLTFNIYFRNISTGLSNPVHSFTFPITYTQTNKIYSTGQFAIYIHRGTQTVHSFKVQSDELQNPDILFIGDSITHGLYYGSLDARWVNQAMLYSNKTYSVNAGSGDTIACVQSRMGEFLRMKPKKVGFMIGGNDVAQAIPTATILQDYRIMRNAFVANGAKAFHFLATPRTAHDMTAFNAGLVAEYQNVDTVIDDFTNFDTGTMLTPDGTHPNATGGVFIASCALQQAPSLYNN